MGEIDLNIDAISRLISLYITHYKHYLCNFKVQGLSQSRYIISEKCSVNCFCFQLVVSLRSEEILKCGI